jgi:hypothetical protein
MEQFKNLTLEEPIPKRRKLRHPRSLCNHIPECRIVRGNYVAVCKLCNKLLPNDKTLWPWK